MNFDDKAKSYDQNADLQRQTSDRLFHSLCQLNPKNTHKILEIGCGTGYLTRKVLEQFPESQVHALDLSPEMLQQSKLAGEKNLELIQADAESFKCEEKYDLIISNLSFQWFEEQLATINKYYQNLNESGYLLINSLSAGTYQQFIEAFEQNQITYPGLSYLSQNDFRQGLPSTATINEYLIKENFPNTRTFLKKLHAIGAHKNKALSTKDLRKVIKTHDSFFSEEIQVEYQILELTIQREQNAK